MMAAGGITSLSENTSLALPPEGGEFTPLIIKRATTIGCHPSYLFGTSTTPAKHYGDVSVGSVLSGLSARSTFCSTLPPVACTLPPTRLALPLACISLLPVSSPALL